MSSFVVLDGALTGVTWTTTSIVGEEAINELFRFTLNVEALRSELGLSDLAVQQAMLGNEVRFLIGDPDLTAGGIERTGVVAAVRAGEPREVDAKDEAADPPADGESTDAEPLDTIRCFRVTVRPRAWLLTQRRNTRIFQGQYLDGILNKVFAEHGLRSRWALTKKYAKRIYCTQYEETDWAFVSRLLAEEGVFFYFEHVERLAEEAAAGGAGSETPDWKTTAAIFDAVKQASDFLTGVGVDAMAPGGPIAGIVSEQLTRHDKAADPEDPAPKVLAQRIEGPHPCDAGVLDVLVLGDDATGYRQGVDSHDDALLLPLSPDAKLDEVPQLFELNPARWLRPDSVHIRDYDFRRPLLELKAGTTTEEQPAGLEIYEHHGDFDVPDIDESIAEIRLDQVRAGALLWQGRGNCQAMLPGHKLGLSYVAKISDLLDAASLPGALAVVRMVHDWSDGNVTGDALMKGCARAISQAIRQGADLGEQELREIIASVENEDRYVTRFELVEAGQLVRPRRPKRRLRNVVETATVVGPLRSDAKTESEGAFGSDVFTDKHGRIKVQFHWDREHNFSDKSSCWMRVIQGGWAGAGYGFQFIPRVGMEVLVAFIGGDPDRPVVIGSLYNQTHPTPFALPGKSSQSGWRSQSTPGGGGNNEFSIDDKRGQERMVIRAQKDFEQSVGAHFELRVNKTQVTETFGEHKTFVGTSQLLGVARDRSIQIGGRSSEFVRGDRGAHIRRNDHQVVEGSAVRRVRGNVLAATEGDDLQQVEHELGLSVRGNAITQVGGAGDNETSHAITFVNGNLVHTATEQVVITAGHVDNNRQHRGGLSLRVGRSVLEIDDEGIRLTAPNISLNATERVLVAAKTASLALDGDGAALSDAQRVDVATAAAQMALAGAVASLKGANIQFATAAGAAAASESAAAVDGASNLNLSFSHMDLAEPSLLNGVPFRVLAGDEVITGRTDHTGSLSVPVPADAAFAQVTLFVQQIDELAELYSSPLTWRVQLVEPVRHHVPEARMGLCNMGYRPGGELNAEELDEITAQALERFRRDIAANEPIELTRHLAEQKDGQEVITLWPTIRDQRPAGELPLLVGGADDPLLNASGELPLWRPGEDWSRSPERPLLDLDGNLLPPQTQPDLAKPAELPLLDIETNSTPKEPK